jgi:hypothetical protein
MSKTVTDAPFVDMTTLPLPAKQPNEDPAIVGPSVGVVPLI